MTLREPTLSPTEAIQLIDGLATDLFDQRDPTAADRYCRPTNSADPVLNREEQS
ncbi:hypothetical protein DFR76_1037 [Nocardia pseudobrasiliensis]|uniref:Uncharacterized protein n=1 Tax=Nocardia pseudobrasiliensis TaxID=45979 RepID=A0A370I876_9NOCA|nr:hypothetical protein DFR76_1037 [Nocardia pseudobrasiliensis]